MPYDPTIYLGSAAHYRYGRPAYSPELEAILTQEAGLDPDASMLAEGCRAAADKPVGQSFHWTDEQRWPRPSTTRAALIVQVTMTSAAAMRIPAWRHVK